MSRPSSDSPRFDEFWSASELTEATQRQYASALSEYTPGPVPTDLDPWSTNAAIRPLGPRPLDDLERAFRARRSVREFGPVAMNAAQLDRLAHSVAGGAQRTFASAGSFYAVQILFALFNVDDALNGSSVRVVSRGSLTGLAPISALQDWKQMAQKFGCLPEMAPPGVVAVVCVDPAAMADKYGERAGRFALIEAGHASQNLTLRAAADELSCYELGGYTDDSLLEALGVRRPGLRVASVLMIGTPAT